MPKIRASLAERLSDDGFVTVAEASRRTSIHPRTIRNWTRSGHVKTRKVGLTFVFVELTSLLAFVGTPAPQQTDDEILADLREGGGE